MIAEVGDIEKVSGRRIATPLAPPKPGRTPMMTPSKIPTTMSIKFCRVSATAKPPMRALISSKVVSHHKIVFFCSLAAGTCIYQQDLFRHKLTNSSLVCNVPSCVNIILLKARKICDRTNFGSNDRPRKVRLRMIAHGIRPVFA